MATLSDLIFERLKNTSWVVVFKNLITAHNLMTLGNEVCTYTSLSAVAPLRAPPPLKNTTQGDQYSNLVTPRTTCIMVLRRDSNITF